jgi:hypothetical protein
MSVLVQNLSDFLKLLIQSFNLSSSFPALVFVILVQLYIVPLLPEESPLRLLQSWRDVGSVGACVVLVALISYLLTVVNRPLIRFFEGYWFQDQWPFNAWKQRNQEYVRDTTELIRGLERQVDALIEQGREERRKDVLERAEELALQKRQLIREIADKYPEDPEYVLSLPLGNVLSAAEQYPRRVFGIDSVVLWPFLVPTLMEQGYSQVIVREKDVLDFCVNLTAVMGAFGCLLGAIEWWVNGLSPELGIKLLFVALGCAVLFYLSIQGGMGWGAAIRSAFVIFREELRRTLHLRQPRDYGEEREIWRSASNFFRAQGSVHKHTRWGHAIFDRTSYETAASKKEEGES